MYEELNNKLKNLPMGSFENDDHVLPVVELLKEEGYLLMSDDENEATQRMKAGPTLGIELGLSTLDRLLSDSQDVDPCELNIAWNNKSGQVTEVFLSEL